MVTKGSVRFGALSETGARVELEAGERSSVSRDNTVPRLPSAFSPDAELAWIQQRYSYSNYSVDAILRDLERTFRCHHNDRRNGHPAGYVVNVLCQRGAA